MSESADVKLVTRLNLATMNFFFDQQFKGHEVCTYDDQFFLFKDVQKLANKVYKSVQYISKKSDEVMYGLTRGFGFYVSGTELVKEPKLEQMNDEIFFDPNMLVI